MNTSLMYVSGRERTYNVLVGYVTNLLQNTATDGIADLFDRRLGMYVLHGTRSASQR